MRGLTVAAAAAFACAAAAMSASTAAAAVSGASCKRVRLSRGTRCIAAGQFCKLSADAQYHRYGFHCHSGRLSTSAYPPPHPGGAGCEPGSPCLPRGTDLNCADIPASKKPVRVTGRDPYRLDGNGDGWGCTSG